jgi:hypothetical protein
MALTLTQIQDYYQSLLARQYVGLPKASATIRNYVSQANGDNLLSSMIASFDISTAIGAQLDIIGKYIGVSRVILGPSEAPYFGFIDSTVATGDPSQNPNGFMDSETPDSFDYAEFFSYLNELVSEETLSDGNFRLLIVLRMISNYGNGSLAGILNSLYSVMGTLIYPVDNKNLTMTYWISPSIGLPNSTLIDNLPRPMGIRVSLVNSQWIG